MVDSRMKFRTEIEPLRRQGELTHSDRILLLGSCFSDNIGNRLRDRLFNVLVNPFGVIYNPASILAVMERAAESRYFVADELIEHEGMFHSFLCHSSLSSVIAGKALEIMNRQLAAASGFLKQSSVVIITFGTAFVYRYNATGEIVSNCHKLPQRMFERRIMSVDETAGYIERIRNCVCGINPDAKIIFTVSPIRHLADGLHGNQLSKSTLLVALNRVVEKYPDNCIYFPAYEAMLDDLRDYRFYAPDMKHPSEVAADYIYDIFARSFFSESTLKISKEAEAFTRRLNHRQLTDNAGARSLFIDETNRMAETLGRKYPELLPAIESYKTFR